MEPYDLSEILGQIARLKEDDPAVKEKVAALRNYVPTAGVTEKALTKMAQFAVVLEKLIKEHEWDGTAIQCWTALEEYYGVVPCTVMSMLSEMKKPSACEADITGLIGMYALTLAADRPSALLDWNNNYGDDPDQGVVFTAATCRRISSAMRRSWITRRSSPGPSARKTPMALGPGGLNRPGLRTAG